MCYIKNTSLTVIAYLQCYNTILYKCNKERYKHFICIYSSKDILLILQTIAKKQKKYSIGNSNKKIVYVKSTFDKLNCIDNDVLVLLIICACKTV